MSFILSFDEITGVDKQYEVTVKSRVRAMHRKLRRVSKIKSEIDERNAHPLSDVCNRYIRSVTYETELFPILQVSVTPADFANGLFKVTFAV